MKHWDLLLKMINATGLVLHTFTKTYLIGREGKSRIISAHPVGPFSDTINIKYSCPLPLIGTSL